MKGVKIWTKIISNLFLQKRIFFIRQGKCTKYQDHQIFLTFYRNRKFFLTVDWNFGAKYETLKPLKPIKGLGFYDFTWGPDPGCCSYVTPPAPPPAQALEHNKGIVWIRMESRCEMRHRHRSMRAYQRFLPRTSWSPALLVSVWYDMIVTVTRSLILWEGDPGELMKSIRMLCCCYLGLGDHLHHMPHQHRPT